MLLNSHEGPVWQVAWAHPKFGPILASASYDGKVIIWKDNGSGSGTTGTNTYGSYGSTGAGSGGWTKIKEHGMHSASGECFVRGLLSPKSALKVSLFLSQFNRLGSA